MQQRLYARESAAAQGKVCVFVCVCGGGSENARVGDRDALAGLRTEPSKNKTSKAGATI